MAIVGLRNLCTPAYVYLVISMISIFIIMIQNSGNSTTYCMGNYSCQVSSLFLVFIVKFVYVIFWTWILNLICNAGAPYLSWFLLLLPFVLMFILIATFMMSANSIPTVDITGMGII
jgi:hypothetical protein